MPGRRFETGINLVGTRATNAGNATQPTDLVTLQQMQAYLNGLDWKLHVRLAATTNVAISNPGTSTFDGVTANAGDRILLPNQTTGSQNNIYIFNGSANAMTLAPDAVQGELDASDTVSVSEGTQYGSRSFTLITKNPITVGTTSLTWSFNNAAIIYSAGSGILINASTYAISVDTSKVPFKYAATLGDGSTLTYTVTHNLAGGADVIPRFYLLSTGEETEVDISNRTTTSFQATFGTAPASNAVRAVVMG